MIKKLVLIVAVLFLIVVLIGCREISKEEIIEKEIIEKEVVEMKLNKTSATLITIYDNYEHDPKLKIGFGFGCIIKTSDKTILFDTGGDSETLLFNMEKIQIKPEEINIVVLSHIHGDHVGGLAGFLEKNSNVKVYVPKSFPSSFKEDVKSAGAEVIDISKAVEICNGVGTTGELGTWLKEQSLIVSTGKGVTIITGCAHPGIVHIVETAKKITDEDVYFVIGGFHLGGASDATLKDIVNSFREFGVEKAGPCHCSGDRARELFKEEFGKDYIANGVGRIIKI